MSIEQILGEHRQSEKTVAARIKQELVDALVNIGEDAPKINVHDEEKIGVILTINGMFGTDFTAVILETDGLRKRHGYFRPDQIMRFSDMETEALRVGPADYLKYAIIAKAKLDSIERAMRERIFRTGASSV